MLYKRLVVALFSGVCSWMLQAEPTRLIITLENEIDSSHFTLAKITAQSVARNAELKLTKFEHLPQLTLLQLPTDTDVAKTIEEIQYMAGVKAVEIDIKVRKTATPNDPEFSKQWHLGTGKGINIQGVWNSTTGNADHVIAVLDTGVDYTHADLAANIWINPKEIASDGIDNDNNGYVDDIYGISPVDGSVNPMDQDGHGTVVAGIIGAVGNNSLGVSGINWSVKILPCRFMNSRGDGYISDAVKCLNYVLDLKKNHNVNIVATNNSWGSSNDSPALLNAIKAHNDAGILFVASAGNGNVRAKFYPAAFDLPNVISVTAHDVNGKKASFANFGRDWVTLSAPGTSILSTFLDDTYATSSGTSMAAPMVSGLVSLLKDSEPSLTAAQIRGRLIASGQNTTDPFISNETKSGKLLLGQGSGQTGALTCVNTVKQRRLTPTANTIYLQSGESIDIKVLSINCNGDGVSVNVKQNEVTLSLKDDGVGADTVANDAVYSTKWVFDGTPTTLSFPDGNVEVINRQQSYCTLQKVSEISIEQCNALVDLYYETRGDTWLKNTNWLTNNTPCNWYGVSCSGTNVVAINLRANALDGSLPASLSALSLLKELDLGDNRLHGVIPASLSALSLLESLELDQNALTGDIPSKLGELQSVKVLDLSTNDLSGAIPSALGNLTALQRLVLSNNSLSDNLPSAIANLTQLTVLWLEFNNLSGSLAQALTGLTSLESFSFKETQLCSPNNAQFKAWLSSIKNLRENTACVNTPPQVSLNVVNEVISGSTVQLIAAANDNDGDTLSYQWQQLSGPQVSLVNAASLNSNFVAPAVTSSTVLRFRFSANDGQTTTSADVELTITPTPASSSSGSSGSSGAQSDVKTESSGGSMGIYLLMLLALISRLRLGNKC